METRNVKRKKINKQINKEDLVVFRVKQGSISNYKKSANKARIQILGVPCAVKDDLFNDHVLKYSALSLHFETETEVKKPWL